MAMSPVGKDPHHWTEGLAAAAIAVGAALLSALCFFHGDAGACVGILAVFGMALVAVIGSRADTRLASSGHLRRAPRQKVPHLACVSVR